MSDITLASYIPIILKAFNPVVSSMGRSVASRLSDQWDQYTGSVASYLQRTVMRHKFFSSVVFSNEGKLLEDYYVPLTLTRTKASHLSNSTRKGSSAVIKVGGYPRDLYSSYNRMLVVDTAGMGKSTLFKFLFLKTIEYGESIPIFVELRRLTTDLNLQSLILQDLAIEDRSNSAFFKKCMATGAFTFYLDGFDEVNDEIKKTVSRDIVKLIEQGRDCKFLISSREEPSLSSLSQFYRFNIRPLELEEAHTLIRKLVTEEEISGSLISKISEASDELAEFLQNPLLVSLLVKSFLHSPTIPAHLSEFYRQVFDALYQTHDAKKELGGYAREKKSGLNLDRFHKCLRGLGVITYKLGKLEYSRDELLIQIEKAMALISDSSFYASDFLDDLLRAVPLFVQEGSRLRWAHRSLQEYFAACYICIDSKQDQKHILMSICESRTLAHNANLLRLCADMDSKTFQETVLKAFLTDVVNFRKNSFKAESFPDVSPADLERRKSVSFDNSFYVMLPDNRAMTSDVMFYDYDALSKEFGFDVHLVIKLNERLMAFEDDDNDSSIMYCCIRSQMKWAYVPLIIMNETFRSGLWENRSIRNSERKWEGVNENTLYALDDDPKNPFNSPINFNTTTDFLELYNHSLELDECEQFLKDIEDGMKKAESLRISF